MCDDGVLRCDFEDIYRKIAVLRCEAAQKRCGSGENKCGDAVLEYGVEVPESDDVDKMWKSPTEMGRSSGKRKDRAGLYLLRSQNQRLDFLFDVQRALLHDGPLTRNFNATICHVAHDVMLHVERGERDL